METQSIFLITPIGKEQSIERQHADKMWNKVFKPLSKTPIDNIKCEFTRLDLLNESSESRIRRIMDLIRKSRGCIVDLYNIRNLNVIYEIGLAHSQGKRVYFLRSNKIKQNDIPSDIQHYSDYYFPYDVEIFDGNACSEEIQRICTKVYEVVRTMFSGDSNTKSFRPSFYIPTEQYVSTVLEGIDVKINNLEKIIKEFGNPSEDERILVDYIMGEDKAFEELTNAVKESKISVKTTRFSPYSVVGRQTDFFSAINDLMSQPLHPNTFERIISANNIEKFDEIAKLMANNIGKDFKIYISKIEYSFEMVVIDDEIVFIHFRKFADTEEDKQSPEKVKLITATLKIKRRDIADEFSTIFDSIKKNSKDIVCEIHCNDLTIENLGGEIEKYRSQFYDAVKDLNNMQ